MGVHINLQILLGQATWIWSNVCKLKNLQELCPTRSIELATNTIKDRASHRDRTWENQCGRVFKGNKACGVRHRFRCVWRNTIISDKTDDWTSWNHSPFNPKKIYWWKKRNLNNNPKFGKLRGSLSLSSLSLSLSLLFLSSLVR